MDRVIRSIAIGVTLSCGIASLGARAADSAAGQRLHDKNCTVCHNSLFGGDGNRIYTRADRRIKSLPGLQAQVRRCEASLGLKWFDEDVDNVVEYLNRTFYKLQ